MALRPVSELGLAEVTDVAGEGDQPSRRPPQRKSPKRVAPGDSRSRPSPQGDGGSTASQRGRTSRPGKPAAATGLGVASLRTSILSGAVGVTGAVLVGRAILRR